MGGGVSMKKQKNIYRFIPYEGQPLKAKREISFEIKLHSRLLLDELCYQWNKDMLEKKINKAIDTRNKKDFLYLSNKYKTLIRE